MHAMKPAAARPGQHGPRAAPARRRWPTAAACSSAAAHAACGRAQAAQPGVSRRDASLALIGLAASSLLIADAAVQPPAAAAAAAAAPAAPAAWQQQAFELSLPSGRVMADVWAPAQPAAPSASAPARLLVFSPGFLVERAAYASLYQALAREG
jgi:hypothetical protein